MEGNQESKEIYVQFLKKLIKTTLYTFFIVLFSLFGILNLVGLAFNNMSVEQQSTWSIICMCIGIVFTIFFCTFSIMEELKKQCSNQRKIKK
jgi:uncharacterized membrane protein